MTDDLIQPGEIAFRLTAHSDQGVSALASLDECRIGEAYLDGNLQSFFDRYNDFLYWGLMLFSFFGSALAFLR